MQWYSSSPEPTPGRPGLPPAQREAAAVADDALRSHHRAMEYGDEVVQQLTVAKYALTIGDAARAIEAIDAALGIARHTLSTLLDVASPPDSLSRAGALVRRYAAGSQPPPSPPIQRPAAD